MSSGEHLFGVIKKINSLPSLVTLPWKQSAAGTRFTSQAFLNM